MQYDLDFLRHAYREEGVPIRTDPDIARDDVLIGTAFDELAHGAMFFMHPLMARELIFHKQPLTWLEEIASYCRAAATRQADALIAQLDADGADDRALIAAAERRSRRLRLGYTVDRMAEDLAHYPSQGALDRFAADIRAAGWRPFQRHDATVEP